MNPVLKILDDLDLSPKMFAIYYGAPQSSIRACLSGNVDKIPIKIKSAIERSGYAVDKIDKEYEEWLKETFRKENDVL